MSAKTIRIVRNPKSSYPYEVHITMDGGQTTRLSFATAMEARTAARHRLRPGWTLTDTTASAPGTTGRTDGTNGGPARGKKTTGRAARSPVRRGIIASFAHLISGSRADAAPVAPEEMRSAADNAERIIAAGKRARGETPAAAPKKPTGLAAKIVAAGRKARGEK